MDNKPAQNISAPLAQAPQSSSPQPASRRTPSWLVFLLILVLLALGGEAYYYFFLSKKPGKPVSKKETVGGLTKLEIAKKALTCLDGMKDERGAYGYLKECPGGGNCRLTTQDNRVGLAVIWGRSKYIEATGDEKELEALRNDITLYLSETIMVIQPDFWSRKLLYDVWQNSALSAQDKQNIQELAKKSRPGESLYLNEVTKKISEANYQPSNINKLLSGEESLTEKIALKDESGFIQAVAFADDFLGYWLWQKDEKDLRTANELFYQTSKEYLSNPESFSIGAKCLLGLASTDFFQTTKSGAYKNFALSIFDSAKLSGACWVEGGCTTELFTPAICALFTENLYKLTNEQSYRELKEKIVSSLIQYNFDYQGFSGVNVNDSCFYQTNVTNKFRPGRENGLLVGLLLL